MWYFGKLHLASWCKDFILLPIGMGLCWLFIFSSVNNLNLVKLYGTVEKNSGEFSSYFQIAFLNVSCFSRPFPFVRSRILNFTQGIITVIIRNPNLLLRTVMVHYGSLECFCYERDLNCFTGDSYGPVHYMLYKNA